MTLSKLGTDTHDTRASMGGGKSKNLLENLPLLTPSSAGLRDEPCSYGQG